MSQATSVSILWGVLYDWVTGVLPGIEVVNAYKDGPAPSGEYIAIDYSGSWRLAGTTPHVVAGTDENKTQIGPRVYTYTGSVVVRDVCGDGESLLLLSESLDNRETVDAFAAAGFSVLRTRGPEQVPSLEQSRWRSESILTLEMAWARGYAGTTPSMESVEVVQESREDLVTEGGDNLVDADKNNLQAVEILNIFNVE